MLGCGEKWAKDDERVWLNGQLCKCAPTQLSSSFTRLLIVLKQRHRQQWLGHSGSYFQG